MDTNICSLCTTDMVNYGVGICNHVICGKCAIRMRVKCQSKECAVCRQNLDRVFITKGRRAFEELDQGKLILNEEHDLLFETKLEERYFLDLMTCKCKVCGDKSSSMSALNRHYNNVHQLMFCDLCMNNLKHFPVEFPVYTGAELVAHRNWTPEAPGRGHPLCKFCEKRYYDADEWYKHLRRDHFMCHVCEKEAANTTTKRTVFGDYDSLLEHCRQAHFVCEEGACSQQIFTNMFASDAELKSHRLTHHNLTKAEARENRRLDVEIRFTTDTANENAMRRDRGGAAGGRGSASGNGTRAYRKNRDPAPDASGLGLEMRNLPGMAQMLEINQAVDAQTAARVNGEVPYQENPQDFPTLRGHAPTFNRPATARASPPPKEIVREDEDLWASPKPNVVKETTEKKSEGNNWQRVVNPSSLNSDDFPALGGVQSRIGGGARGGGVWQKNSKKAGLPANSSNAVSQRNEASVNNSDDFPSLGKTTKTANLPWKGSTPAAPTQAKTPTPKLSNPEEFPSLMGGRSNSGPPTKNLPWESIVKAPKISKKSKPSQGRPVVTSAVKSADFSNSYKAQYEDHSTKSNDDQNADFHGSSYAEEKIGRRLTAAEAYESHASRDGQTGKIQLIKEAPAPVSRPCANGGIFQMTNDDFPAMSRLSGKHALSDNRWGQSNISNSDLYLEVLEETTTEERKKTPYQQEFVAPNVESTSDFPSLGSKIRERVDPIASTQRGHSKENKKGKKSKKPRQNRSNNDKEYEDVEEHARPAEAPFSLGDLAASLLNVKYHEVPEMDARNQILFDSLVELLGERFDRFALISKSYRNREISARSYIDSIGELVSKTEVASFMPEMMVLLPDIGLQKSLMAVIQPELRRHLRECSTCGQIVTTEDLPFHLSVH